MVLLTSMDFHVLTQTRAGHIGFLRLLALKRSLSSVYSLVKDAVVVFKVLPVFLLLMGSFFTLNILVANEGRRHEGFPTLAALVRPSSSVISLVQSQYIFVVEGFPTFTAPESCAPFAASLFYRGNRRPSHTHCTCELWLHGGVFGDCLRLSSLCGTFLPVLQVRCFLFEWVIQWLRGVEAFWKLVPESLHLKGFCVLWAPWCLCVGWGRKVDQYLLILHSFFLEGSWCWRSVVSYCLARVSTHTGLLWHLFTESFLIIHSTLTTQRTREWVQSFPSSPHRSGSGSHWGVSTPLQRNTWSCLHTPSGSDMTCYSSWNTLYSPGLSHGILTGRLRYCPSIIKQLGCFASSMVWKYHFCDGRGTMGKLPSTMLQKYLILCSLESNVKSHIVCVLDTYACVTTCLCLCVLHI